MLPRREASWGPFVPQPARICGARRAGRARGPRSARLGAARCTCQGLRPRSGLFLLPPRLPEPGPDCALPAWTGSPSGRPCPLAGCPALGLLFTRLDTVASVRPGSFADLPSPRDTFLPVQVIRGARGCSKRLLQTS